jgi:two-component system, NtrC family, response regulator HydG
MSRENTPKASILIVDDNVSLDRTMSFILERKGYSVTIAESGEQALERVREQPFDLIFLDIQMPLMNGTEACKAIKAIRPGAAVVMMTAYAVEDLVNEALQSGARAVLYKPVDVEKLIDLVEAATDDRNGGLILIVDDDDGACATLKKVLVREQFKVGVAHTGEAALQLAAERAYDVVLIDMKLPTINGLETYLRLHKINPQAVAVMMTGYREEMADLVNEALSHDAYACIYKPIDMGRLLQLIEEIREKLELQPPHSD